MATTRRLRRISPLLVALLALALVITLPGIESSGSPSAHADDEPLQLEPEIPQLALIEVDDPMSLSLLASQGVDLDHYMEPTEDGTVISAAFVTESDRDTLAAMGVKILDLEDLPDPAEVAAERMGNVDGREVVERSRQNRGVGRGQGAAGREPVVDQSGPIRILRADTFTNYAGDFLSVEARLEDWSSAANRLRVDAPSSAAGGYDVTDAAFGPTAPATGITAPLAVVDAGGDNPRQGCGPLSGFPDGAIAVAERGGCPFVEIVGNAQAAGAVAVVVVNNVASAPITLGGSDGSITIPSGMVSQSDGQAIIDGLPATATFRSNPQDPVVLSYEIDGQEFSRTLSPFVDAGQYIYHRTPRSVLVGGIAEEVTVSQGDVSVTVPTRPWASYDEIGYPDGFQWGFITTGYPDAVDSTNKIEELVAEFSDLAEIIELPHQSHGYRRPAMLTYGNLATNAVVVRSQAYGHEGGNDLTFAVVNPGVPDAPLEVSVEGDDITVSQSTNAAGAATGTAAQIVAAINGDPVASELIYAHTYRGNAGGGVTPTSPRAGLSDFLNAPEDKISREPQTVKAIRIGKHRDGSKVGVFAYSQEHAREWVTPVVALEAAERLLRNYGTDPDTTRYVDELDIFIIPTVNPDGTNYSLYDFASQRRNMNNYCDDTESDPAYRNQWGVDLNRNFRVGTLWDGYSGASTSCRSDVFAGPSPLSETEVQNEVWLIDNHPNIRFSMNIHTHGGYFMWAPGAYQAQGRVPLERPSVGVEEYFFEASDVILGKIAEHRGTVVEPGRTGPTIDVLYSAAGNSADDVWYSSVERGTPIFAWNFEAGANRYTGAGSTGWQSINGFFPPFAEEGFDQAMEFASGIYGLLEVAAEFQDDDVAPTSRVNVQNGGWYNGAVDVEWTTSEPATIYYTTDGSRPTFDSNVVERRDVRDSAAPVRIEETTVLRWFAVDAAGNIEGGYDPDGNGRNYQRVNIRIR
ncbi:M14 family zinc carboxypeptidase [Egicoccus sp. AB-alg2]|uniref:M14 family metallopeptidase n=1 Tax=Egicoccus sp. AB-alg2 TaxID=3242693 RepID=UPI00359CD87F